MSSPRQTGTSLVEVLIVLVTGCLVLGALFLLFRGFQLGAASLQELVRREDDFWLCPVLLVNWISPAGCGPAVPSEAAILLSDTVVSLQADQDGPAGFPDGTLQQSFEDVSITAREGSLRIRSGRGSFQPFLASVDAIRFSMPLDDLLQTEIESVPLASPGAESTAGPRRRATVLIHLENLGPTCIECGESR